MTTRSLGCLCLSMDMRIPHKLYTKNKLLEVRLFAINDSLYIMERT